MVNQLSFNVEAAKIHGVEGAVLLSHIVYWVYRNMTNNTNFINNQTWTYNSANSFAKLFPFWQSQKIRRLLVKLEKENAIIIGLHNKAKYDRTKWYTITKQTENLYLKDYSNLNNGILKNEECNIQNQKNESLKVNNLYQITNQVTTKITTKEKVIMPFHSELFLEAWNLWKKYKKEEKNFRFKSSISEQASLLNLQKISNNNEQESIKIIHNAIAQGWAGLYADKKDKGKKGFDNDKYLAHLDTL